MNARDFSHTAVVAQAYDGEEYWDVDSFRFKRYDDDVLGMDTLLTLKNRELIIERDDGWSTTTWVWSERGDRIVEMATGSPLMEASDTQLEAIQNHADTILGLPLKEKFLAREQDLIGQELQTLSRVGLIKKVGEDGGVSVWKMSDDCVRYVNTVAGVGRRFNEGNEARLTTADD